MKARMNSRWLVASALLALALGGAPALAQDGAPEYADDYRTGDYGRVRDAENGLTIVRAQWNHEQGVSDDGVVNSPVFPGDKIRTGSDQRAEIQLASGALVWADRGTAVTFLALPDPYAEILDNTVLQLAEGRIRVAASLLDDEEFRIDTPAASVYPVGDAELRVDVERGGRTRVFSRRGVVEVVGNGASVLVRAGTFTEIDPGSLPYDAESFNTLTGDGFDGYVARREQVFEYRDGYAGGPDVYRELPGQVQPYYRELSAHGSWVHVDEQGYVWQPGGVASDWRPYYDGYWGYGPDGYFWISYEPWGWAPYHYGRWTWIGGRGWCWSPGSVFAGAWVSWSWGSVYVGWSPLDYWDYPAYYSTRHYGYYDPHCWTFVSYHHFHHRHYGHYSVSWDHVKHDVHRSAVVTRPPRVAPGRLASSPAERHRAARAALDDRRHKIPPAERSRASTGRSFRTSEKGLVPRDRGTRARRDTALAPAGRERSTPTSTRSGSYRDKGRRVETIRRGDGGGRERLPVVTTPHNRRGLTRDTGERAARPRAERSSAPRVRTQSGNQRAESDKRGATGRVRDIYRKMSKPRQTRERTSVSGQSGNSGTRRARPSTPARTPSKPARTPTGHSRPKSGSGGEKKATPPSRGSKRGGKRPGPSAQQAPRSAPQDRSYEARVSPQRSYRVNAGSRRSDPRSPQRRQAAVRSETSPRSGSSAARVPARRSAPKTSTRAGSRSGSSAGKSVSRSRGATRSPGRSVSGGSKRSKPTSRSGSSRGRGSGRRR
jgi:hypothetical protein